MRVGINARYLHDPGLRGFNRYTLCLLRELQKVPEIDLVLFAERRRPVHPVYRAALNAEVIELPAPKALWWEQVVLPRALKHYGVEVFHAPADAGLPAVTTCPSVLTYHGAIGILRARRQGFLPPEQGWRGWRRGRRHDWLLALYLRRADRVITVSDFSRQELVERLHVPPDKIRVIYEAADSSLVHSVSPREAHERRRQYGIVEPYLLYVGGLDEQKNVLGLIRVFAELRSRRPSVSLVVAYQGGDVAVHRTMARQAGAETAGHVLFLENVPQQDLAALYCGALAFVTLSWAESFCLPVVEAMSCGVPVVASSWGAIPEILGEGGLLVDPSDPPGVVATLLDVTDSPSLRESLQARARRRAQGFSWEKAAKETIAVYTHLVATAR